MQSTSPSGIADSARISNERVHDVTTEDPSSRLAPRRLPQARPRHATRLSLSALRVDGEALAVAAARAAADIALRGHGPVFGDEYPRRPTTTISPSRATSDPIGERIVVSGRVLDANARPVANTLVEIWQANSAGRYPHRVDQHNAPLDPNFHGCGRTMTDAEGRYRFVSIRPGAYPWRNHPNAWRPAHIHFSLFGPAFATRLVTQMYFPGDPLLDYDPMYASIPDERARQRLVSTFDWETTIPDTGARLPVRHRASRSRRRRRWKTTCPRDRGITHEPANDLFANHRPVTCTSASRGS